MTGFNSLFRSGKFVRILSLARLNSNFNKFFLLLALYLLLIISGGSVHAAVNYGAGDDPRSVATGDFNGDGDFDLAVVNAGSDDVSILIGNGDGTFQAAENDDTGDNPASVTTGDFDEDGQLDLAVANTGSDDVSILLEIIDILPEEKKGWEWACFIATAAYNFLVAEKIK